MKLYPLFADLTNRPVLVVGGGAVAERKIAALLDAQARITVHALELTPQLQAWATRGGSRYATSRSTRCGSTRYGWSSLPHRTTP